MARGGAWTLPARAVTLRILMNFATPEGRDVQEEIS
jgi:hypothetical protein